MKTVDFDKGPKSILVSECRWSFLVAPTLCETPSRYTYISVEERILLQRITRKITRRFTRSRRILSLTPAEGRKKERKKVESTRICSALILRIPPRRLARSGPQVRVARSRGSEKFPPYSFWLAWFSFPRPILPPRHSGLSGSAFPGGKKENDKQL